MNKSTIKRLLKSSIAKALTTIPNSALLPAILSAVLMAGLSPANAAEPLSWVRKPNQPAPAQFDTFHGQSLEFRCTFTGFGSMPFGSGVISGSGASAPFLYYQTNGMGNAWWSIPATTSAITTTNGCGVRGDSPVSLFTNYVLASTFPPSADPGAERLTVFFGAPSNAYAAAQVRFRNSPGAHPNDLDPPSVLDWQSELSSATNSLMASLTSATNDLFKSFAPTISNTVTKAYVESLGIESGVDAQTVTNMTALTPVYGGDGERFGAWVFTPPTYNGVAITMQTLEDGDGLLYVSPVIYGSAGAAAQRLYDDSVRFDWVAGENADITLTSTRTENPIIGYTLGSQTNSVLAATNGIVTAETATNIVIDLTYGYLATTGGVVTGNIILPQTQGSGTKTVINGNGITAGYEGFTIDSYADTLVLKGSSASLKFSEIVLLSGWDSLRGDDGYSVPYLIAAATNDLHKSLDPTITNIASTVSSNAIASADTTYRRTIGITNLNQSVQYVNITDTTPSTLEIQLPTDGATKDWMVYVVSVTNVTLSLPSATWWMADVAYTNDVPPATPTALWFSQITDGIFILGRQELTPVSVEGGN